MNGVRMHQTTASTKQVEMAGVTRPILALNHFRKNPIYTVDEHRPIPPQNPATGVCIFAQTAIRPKPKLRNGNLRQSSTNRVTAFAEAVFMSSLMTRCPTCLGIGMLLPSKECPTCDGTGTIDERVQAERRKSAISLEKTVITISRDEALQMTRTELLTRAGYSVIALTTDNEVMKYLALDGQPSINLILLCHSVPEASRISLCKALKKSIPNAPILMLENSYDPQLLISKASISA